MKFGSLDTQIKEVILHLMWINALWIGKVFHETSKPRTQVGAGLLNIYLDTSSS